MTFKKLTYFKLNEYDYNQGCFPLCFAGVFNDGINQFPIFQHLQAEVIFECFDMSVTDADNLFLKEFKLKKIPTEVGVVLNNK